jgi:hypothetical protein
VVLRSLQIDSTAVIFCCGSKTRRGVLVVFIVYILSRIVDKFFFGSSVVSIEQHPHLALLRPDHHRLAAHATHHVEGIHRSAPQRQLQRVLGNSLFDGLPQLVGDLEEPVGGAKPPDPLVRPLVVVILHPQRGARNRLIEAVKLRPLQKLPQDRLPETLDLAERHGVVRPGPDVPHTVLVQFLLEARLAPPVRVLPAVVGQDLLGDPVVGHSATIGLQNVLGRLAAVQSKCCDVAAVVVDKPDQVGVVPPQSDSQDIALPELVGSGALEEARLGWVLLRLEGPLLHQPPRRECLVNRSRAGAHQEESLENIGDPPRPVLRVLGLDCHRLLPELFGHSADPARRHLGLKPRLTVKPVGSHPALDRMRADPELLHQ